MTARAPWIPLVAALATAPAVARADDPPRDVPVTTAARADLLFRFLPQPRLTVEENAAGAVDRYWRALATAPLYGRVSADAWGLWNGRAEAHVAGWAAVDLFTSQDQVAAGDLALAWASARLGAFTPWGGRRFLAWGLPGGAHVDGGGVEIRPTAGLAIELVGGRPVTPRYDGAMGATPSFDGAAALWGARATYTSPGKFTAALGYMERWGEGIPAQRVLSAEALWSPTTRIDLRGAALVDGNSGDVVQARAEALFVLGRRADVSAGWAHADVARLIPRWSILSAFVGPVYDEFFVGGAYRFSRAVSLGLEGALRLLDVPGRDPNDYGPTLAYRVDARLRVMSGRDGAQALIHLSRRDDGVTRLTVFRAATSIPFHPMLFGMLEAAAAMDGDDPSAPRSAYYGRASLEVRLGGAWRVGATVDALRAVTSSELRGTLHASWVLSPARSR